MPNGPLKKKIPCILPRCAHTIFCSSVVLSGSQWKMTLFRASDALLLSHFADLCDLYLKWSSFFFSLFFLREGAESIICDLKLSVM